jgi:hypothetical protein
MPHLTVNVRPEHAEQLKAEQRHSGAPVSVQVRRALDEYFTNKKQQRLDAQVKRNIERKA